MSLKLIASVSFSLFNVVTRKFNAAYVVHTVFLLDRAILRRTINGCKVCISISIRFHNAGGSFQKKNPREYKKLNSGLRQKRKIWQRLRIYSYSKQPLNLPLPPPPFPPPLSSPLHHHQSLLCATNAWNLSNGEQSPLFYKN